MKKLTDEAHAEMRTAAKAAVLNLMHVSYSLLGAQGKGGTESRRAAKALHLADDVRLWLIPHNQAGPDLPDRPTIPPRRSIELTDALLCDIHERAKAAESEWQRVWELGMKHLRVDSPRYRRICRAGRALDKLVNALACAREDRGLHAPEGASLFGAAWCAYN